jgi:hypothetical protein
MLDRLDASQPEFEGALAKFIEAGREHIAYEEGRPHPAAPRHAAQAGHPEGHRPGGRRHGQAP